MAVDKDSRGFVVTNPISSVYGGEIRVTESSAALHARLWIFAKSPVDMNAWFEDPENYSNWNETAIHLNIEDAELFANNILEVIRNHRMYEGKDAGYQNNQDQ